MELLWHKKNGIYSLSNIHIYIFITIQRFINYINLYIVFVWVPVAKYTQLFINWPYSLGSLESVLSDAAKFSFVRRLSESA